MPTTLSDLIRNVGDQRAAAARRAESYETELRTLTETVEAIGRDANTAELERGRDLRSRADTAATEARRLEERLSELQAIAAEEAEIERRQAQITPTGGLPTQRQRTYDQVGRVGAEARTYRPDTDPHGITFLRDVIGSSVGDFSAHERMSRHMNEERVERGEYLTRAASTGSYTGLVVPQYLVDMYAPAVAALSPFADICTKHPLPEQGMTINISRITTPTAVGLQAAQNAAVANQDASDTLLTLPILTAAGQQQVARQLIERGAAAEDVIMNDLFRRYSTTLDTTLLNAASTGLVNQVNTMAYTTGSPTVQGLNSKLLGACSNIETALLGQASPSHAVMHPRRWAWMQSQVGPNWPFIAQPGLDPQSGGSNFGTKYGSGARGLLPNGLVAIVDANITTTDGGSNNQDQVFVVAADECHLWEDPKAPMFVRYEQTYGTNLTVTLVLWSYFAYTFGRYGSTAHQMINGTGLVAPSF